MYDQKSALFSYSSRLDENGMKNNFSHSSTIRYTINSLVGFQKARAFQKTKMDLNRTINRFLDLHSTHITNAGDQGLLLYLLASSHHHKQHDWFEKLEKMNILGLKACFVLMTFGFASGIGLAITSTSLNMTALDWLTDAKIVLIALICLLLGLVLLLW